jgi:hypothetical protein
LQLEERLRERQRRYLEVVVTAPVVVAGGS